MTKHNTVACYQRVSTSGQSLASQRSELEQWVAGNVSENVEVRWYKDKATGNNLERPGFEQLQKDVFNGEIRTVVVVRLDRVSRKLNEGLDAITGWLENGIRFVSTSQQFDFRGSVGKLILAVLLGVAEMEQQIRSERQQAGIAEAKKRGAYKGRKPGSVNKKTRDNKASPERAKALKQQGLKVAEIARSLGVSRPTVYKYLND